MNKVLNTVLMLSVTSAVLAGCQKPKFYANQKAETLSNNILSGADQGDGADGGITVGGTGGTDGTNGGITVGGTSTGGTTGGITTATPTPTPTPSGTTATPTPTPTPSGTTATPTPTPTPASTTYTPGVDLLITVGSNPNVVVPGVTNPGGLVSPVADNLNGGTALPTANLCSDGRTNTVGTNVASASSLTLKVYNEAGQVACTLTDTVAMKAQVKNNYISIRNCNLPNGEYSLVVISPNNKVLGAPTQFDISAGAITNGSKVHVLADSNVGRTGALAYQGYPCDTTASPLYIDFRTQASWDFLSAPQDGVLFDILGANNSPAYTKSQISWFTEGRMAMLALPDQNGQVNNIDQLFGNNTKDANGNFAANGFLALAKHDSNADQMIDANDPVFASLRLWFDKNRDGVAQARELETLSARSVVSLDLAYDPNFAEVDQYGNEILYKSVVNLRNGQMKPMFDVWFKLAQ